MWQRRLNLVVRKLSLLGLYLLFLSVQLHLKYTFSDSLSSDYSSYLSNNSKTGITTGSQNDKPVVQKLRLNKRYVHENVFLVYSLESEPVQEHYIKVNETTAPVPPVISTTVSHALLRGPPRTENFSC